jgi:hypothetical protein
MGVPLRVGLSAVSFAPLRCTKGCRLNPSRGSVNKEVTVTDGAFSVGYSY